MIRAFTWFRDRHIRRGFAQLEQHTRASDGQGELLLTRDHMLAYIDLRLNMRKLDRIRHHDRRSKSALKGWETRRQAA